MSQGDQADFCSHLENSEASGPCLPAPLRESCDSFLCDICRQNCGVDLVILVFEMIKTKQKQKLHLPEKPSWQELLHTVEGQSKCKVVTGVGETTQVGELSLGI